MRSYNLDEEGPIVIFVPFPFANGKPQSIVAGETVSDLINIKNTISEPVELWKVDIYDSNPKDSFTISLMVPPSATSDWDYVQGLLESFCLEDRIFTPYCRDMEKKQLVAYASAENAYVVGDRPIKASNRRFKYNFSLPLYLIPKHVIGA
ncbi:RNA helicase, partial [Sarracenia purpurea var. burkii]